MAQGFTTERVKLIAHQGGQVVDFLQLSGQFGVLLGRFAILLFLCQHVVGPAFDIIRFEDVPFLTVAIIIQTLEFGDLVDAAFKALGDIFGALDRLVTERRMFRAFRSGS